MRHLKALMESRSFDRVPDQTLLASDPDTGRNHVRASLAASRLDAVVYAPTGNDVSVRMDRLAGFVRATRFDPRDGTSTSIGVFTNRGTMTFDPPGSPAVGNDWVLVLEVV
jgi:hypothetical protein